MNLFYIYVIFVLEFRGCSRTLNQPWEAVVLWDLNFQSLHLDFSVRSLVVLEWKRTDNLAYLGVKYKRELKLRFTEQATNVTTKIILALVWGILADFWVPHEIDSWNFQHMLDLWFSEASQNLSSFRQLLFSLFHGEDQREKFKIPAKTIHCFLNF